MKYYEIRGASDPSVIGVKDGLSQVEIKREGFNDKARYDEITQFFKSPEYYDRDNHTPANSFQVEYAVMRKGAILNDFISFFPHFVGCHYIISDRARALLESFRMPEHYLFPTRIYKGADPLKESYYVLYCPLLPFNSIDFPRSSFYTGSDLLGNKKYVSIESEVEFRKNLLVNKEKVLLKEGFDSALDFFCPKTGGVFVSQPLMEEIGRQKITGLNLPREKGTIYEYPE